MKFITAYFIVASIALLGAAPLQAAPISSDEILNQAQVQYERENLLAMVNSSEVNEKLVELGVSPEQAKARIAAMTPSELAQLNKNLEELPAGGVVGTVVTVFVVLFILDALGVTDVFDFVDPI